MCVGVHACACVLLACVQTPCLVNSKSCCLLTMSVCLQAACEDMSAQLVEVYSEDVNNFLENMMNSYGYGGEDRCTWMGMNDMAQEDKFLWDASQREPYYNDWAAGEPNNIGGNEDCVHFFLFDYEVWNDAPCHFQFRFICQLR